MDPFEYLSSLGQFKMRPGLERVEAALKYLGDPHLMIPAVHIGGTNGKGSTAAMVEAILSSFKVRTGSYTSPHLLDVTERLRLSGSNVDKERLGEKISLLMEMIRSGIPKEGLTYFELLTVASFLIMKDENVDINISEVGLGGRWDATNIIEPQAVAITTISMDHMEHLGEDPISITHEKCGIIKPATPVIVGKICSRIDDTIRCSRRILDVCTHNGCPVILLAGNDEVDTFRDLLSSYNIPDWRILEIEAWAEMGRTFGRFHLHSPVGGSQKEPRFDLLDGVIENEFSVPLVGEHQAWNMGIAVILSLLALPFSLAHARLRKGEHDALGNLIRGCTSEVSEPYSCDELVSIIKEGLQSVKIPGRMEIFEANGHSMVIDGGHNREAAWALMKMADDLFPGKDIHLLMAMMKDKRPEDLLDEFGQHIKELTITTLDIERAMATKDLMRYFVEMDNRIGTIHIRDDTSKAIDEWMKGLGPESVGLATGSFYLYSALFERLKNGLASKK